MARSFPVTADNRVRRLPERGQYDRDLVYAILDAGFVCHVGYVHDGRPFVTPTAYWRDEHSLYWHGSAASRMLRTLAGGIPACVTVTHLDGLVLARSAFHHSMNYRSVMAFGIATVVPPGAEQVAALQLFTERLVPGRWSEIRQPTSQELKATTVMRMPLELASAKVRTGPPIDDAEDYELSSWAGVVPFTLTRGAPEPDPRLRAGIAIPPALHDRVQGGLSS